MTMRKLLLSAASSGKSGRSFSYGDCPGAGLRESGKSFLRYRWRHAMDWFLLALAFVLRCAVSSFNVNYR